MTERNAQHMLDIQSSMEESARPAFDDEDVQQLRILIRLTVEFQDFLGSRPSVRSDPDELMYRIDRIFVHIESFRSLTHLYGVLVGSATSAIDWDVVGTRSVKERFLSDYERFISETNFENKCRLLLDLFKLQIIFAGAYYDFVDAET